MTCFTTKNSHVLQFTTLLVVVVIYCVFGGCVFTYLDNRCREKSVVSTLEVTKRLCHSLCMDLRMIINEFEGNKTNSSLIKNISIIRVKCTKFCDNNLNIQVGNIRNLNVSKGGNKSIDDIKCNTWSFHNLFEYSIFSFTAITTIGYGDFVPKSDHAKVVIIFYSLLGIPIALAMLAEASEVSIHNFSKGIVYFERNILGRRDVSRDNFKIFFAALCSFLLTIFVGSVITTNSEFQNMSRLNAVYFWFVSITTIGFGDIDVDRSSFHDWNIFIYLLYALCLIFGLALMASLLNVASKIIMKGRWGKLSCCDGFLFDDELYENKHTICNGTKTVELHGVSQRNHETHISCVLRRRYPTQTFDSIKKSIDITDEEICSQRNSRSNSV